MLYGELHSAREAFKKGENVTSYLRKQFGVVCNTPDIIEIAYDLQAGSYVEFVKNNRDDWKAYTNEIAGILSRHCNETDSILDVGTGEMTTLVGVAKNCYSGTSTYFACDISWSRLDKGKSFLTEELSENIVSKLQPVVADMFHLPFVDGAVDVVWTSHALEPNGGKEKEALSELLRVARKKLVLFEPFYEENSSAGKERMDRLGYIKRIPCTVRELGAICEEIVRLTNIDNPLNPTYAFIITPPCRTDYKDSNLLWACPATRLPMSRFGNCFWSEYSMLAYPFIRDIPILRPEAAILATSFK